MCYLWRLLRRSNPRRRLVRSEFSRGDLVLVLVAFSFREGFDVLFRGWCDFFFHFAISEKRLEELSPPFFLPLLHPWLLSFLGGSTCRSRPKRRTGEAWGSGDITSPPQILMPSRQLGVAPRRRSQRRLTARANALAFLPEWHPAVGGRELIGTRLSLAFGPQEAPTPSSAFRAGGGGRWEL